MRSRKVFGIAGAGALLAALLVVRGATADADPVDEEVEEAARRAPIDFAVLKDPTRRPLRIETGRGDAAPIAPLVLSAILFSGDRRIAIINDRSVRVGDEVDGARVLAISPDRVRIRRGESVQSLALATVSMERRPSPQSFPSAPGGADPWAGGKR